MRKNISISKATYYELSPDEIKAVLSFLQGDIGLRPLGDALGVSHTGATYVVVGIVKQWIYEGKVSINYGKVQA